MRYGLLSGILWGLDTTILGIALAMAPFIGTAEAIALAGIVSSFLHDAMCAVWITLYMAIRGRLKDTVTALKTRSGKVVMLAALLGGPLGMSGYVIAISNIGPAYTAIISAFYPAFGTIMAVLILKERITVPRIIALMVALGGIIALGAATIGSDEIANPVLGVSCALLCVVGWGSEAVMLAWGMKDDNVDNETALQIRETTSALAYALFVIPAFGAWAFSLSSAPTLGGGVVALAALAGTVSYLFYYKGIATIGAARCMPLNISYSAWAVIFSAIFLGSMPTLFDVICCIAILAGTILAASDWNELFGKKDTAA